MCLKDLAGLQNESSQCLLPEFADKTGNLRGSVSDNAVPNLRDHVNVVEANLFQIASRAQVVKPTEHKYRFHPALSCLCEIGMPVKDTRISEDANDRRRVPRVHAHLPLANSLGHHLPPRHALPPIRRDNEVPALQELQDPPPGVVLDAGPTPDVRALQVRPVRRAQQPSGCHERHALHALPAPLGNVRYRRRGAERVGHKVRGRPAQVVQQGVYLRVEQRVLVGHDGRLAQPVAPPVHQDAVRLREGLVQRAREREHA